MLICILLRKTIHSPIKIEDKVITERKTRGRSKVGDQYTYRSEYKQNRVDIVNDVFAKVNEVIQEMKAAGPEEQKR